MTKTPRIHRVTADAGRVWLRALLVAFGVALVVLLILVLLGSPAFYR